MALTDKLKAIADGFRSSRGVTDQFTLEQMATMAAEPGGVSVETCKVTIQSEGLGYWWGELHYFDKNLSYQYLDLSTTGLKGGDTMVFEVVKDSLLFLDTVVSGYSDNIDKLNPEYAVELFRVKGDGTIEIAD